MLIGQLGERVGLPAQTIRYYERLGLLERPQRSKSRYRLYQSHDEERLRFILRAKRFGLSLHEINQVIGLHDNGIRPCPNVMAMMEGHLRQLNERIAELQALRRELEIRCRDMLAAGAVDSGELNGSGDTICPLIERSATGHRET